MYAMVLSVLDPTLTDKLMERAEEYATHRIVCGHHWKSDIDAALLLIAGIFPMVVASDEFPLHTEEKQHLRAANLRILH